eukprot:11529365-Ditylum_brightwellii.AAC.1
MKKGKGGVRLWSISNALKQMIYEEVTTEHICQGPEDPHNNWCKARFNLNNQFLICCKKLDLTKDVDPPLPKKDGKEVQDKTTNANAPADDEISKGPIGDLIKSCFNIQCKPFDYTGRTICSEKDIKKYEREETYPVKNLKEERGSWLVNNRIQDALWEEEDSGALKGVGGKATE